MDPDSSVSRGAVSIMKSAKIPLADIVIPENRLRRLDEAALPALMDSIQEVGLRTPISVQRRGRNVVLIVGLHRLEAMRKLEKKEIDAVFVDLTEAECELWEIDENLARSELSPAERTACTTRRVELVEQRYRATCPISPEPEQQPGRKTGVSEAAKQTGRDPSKVRKDVRNATAIPNLAEVAGTSLDKGVEIDALAKLPVEQQAALIARAKTGEVVTARVTPPPLPIEVNYKRFKKGENLTYLAIALYTVFGHTKIIRLMRCFDSIAKSIGEGRSDRNGRPFPFKDPPDLDYSVPPEPPEEETPAA